MFLAHVRAALGGTVERVNCHPFHHGRWLFQHNGAIPHFPELKRELTFDISPDLYPFVEGNADSEVCFHLALTYGLETDPKNAFARMVGRIEAARAEHGIDEPFVGTFCAADGESIHALRYSSDRSSRTLYHSVGHMRLTSADHGGRIVLPDDGRIIVSEPLEPEYRDTHWAEIPEWSFVTVRAGAEPVVEDFEPAT
ncbi:class II glutamine amidotransferase [Gordonia sp. DT219]|uniref:class II glutamine amidotransferase n=1 Tax=Gordonia sp. DT219 TaxID=3416658 RepID=UPI003CE8E4A1